MQFKLYYPVIGLRSRVVQLGGAEVSRLKAEVEQLKSVSYTHLTLPTSDLV